MVQNPPCWKASCALEQKKKQTKKFKLDWLESLCFEGCHNHLSSSMVDFIPCDRLLQKAN